MKGCPPVSFTYPPHILKEAFFSYSNRVSLMSYELKGNSGIFKPRPYFWHEIRLSTHREQFGESRRPSEDI